MNGSIKQIAHELGFDLCGLCEPDPGPFADFYLEWVSVGFHGQMRYMARSPQKRADVRQLFPNVRTIICVGASYWVESHLTNEAVVPPDCGLVARYARFEDYHDVLGRQLNEFVERLRKVFGSAEFFRWYVDTGPVLERAYAMKAGLGFIGKHTGLINPGIGPWVFLGEVLTSVSLSFDPGCSVSCGKCRKCIDACPTQAIVKPYVVDAQRCISYLTIEHREGIPEELRTKVGWRIFGCDECLKVCPWNRNNKPGVLMPRYARPEITWIPLAELFQSDEEAFKRKYGTTPLAYAGLWKLRRNACIVAGNIGTKVLIPILEKVACNSDSILAEHAQWAIRRITTSTNRT